MDHRTIDDSQLVERYLMGRLPAAERERFEEHFLSCPQCQDRLELAEGFRLGLGEVVAGEAAAAARADGPARPRRWRWPGTPRAGLALAAGLAALFLLPTVWLAVETSRLRAERDRALAGAAASAEEVQAARRELAAARADARAADRGRAAAERRRADLLAARLDQELGPRGNVQVVPLSLLRSGPGEPAPRHRLRLAPEPGWLVLSLELDGLDRPPYRATLEGADGRAVWSLAGLRPDGRGALTVGLHGARLAPGDYLLRVEGVPARGPAVPVARFPLRLLPAR